MGVEPQSGAQHADASPPGAGADLHHADRHQRAGRGSAGRPHRCSAASRAGSASSATTIAAQQRLPPQASRRRWPKSPGPGPCSAAVHPDHTVSYSYSTDDGATFLSAGAPMRLASWAWWKGARPGLFTFNTRSSSGRVDVDWFTRRRDEPRPIRRRRTDAGPYAPARRAELVARRANVEAPACARRRAPPPDGVAAPA